MIVFQILPDFPEEHRSKARQTLLGLFSTSKRLPSSIFIAGVIDIEGPIFGGGFADIYRAMYRGKAVAVKRLHSYMNAEDVWLVRFHLIFGCTHMVIRMQQRFCREALVWQNLKNPYILPLIGIDRDSFSPALCMVSPWMELGTSLKYLRDNGRRTVNKLVSI